MTPALRTARREARRLRRACLLMLAFDLVGGFALLFHHLLERFAP